MREGGQKHRADLCQGSPSHFGFKKCTFITPGLDNGEGMSWEQEERKTSLLHFRANCPPQIPALPLGTTPPARRE